MSERVPLDDLAVVDSPRLGGVDIGHAKALAESGGGLPPIAVHRRTMRVIDGAHRVQAARLRGDDTIEVRLYDGSEAELFVQAVRANNAHGLPLTLAERKAAAARIVDSHPQWSDRGIAAITALSPKTVGRIRQERCASEEVPQSHTRLGRDGRPSSSDATAGREVASRLFREQPGISMRQVARTAGISTTTARDVQARLRRGEAPVAPRRGVTRPAEQGDGAAPAEVTSVRALRRPGVRDVAGAAYALRKDPSLRLSETGRTLIRMLDALPPLGPQQWQQIADNLPPHCLDRVDELARQRAEEWRNFAEMINHRLRKTA
ncbi:hypothetical protein [Streptomyces sp. NPDC006645]|uniref:ParB/RepB/Spo0J family partition protein n=1 Tax=unclassified Streptomyces TaxID=2593676 RepID=UPI0033A71414